TVLDVGAAREVLERLLLTVLDDLEVLGVEIREVLALLVDDGDAEGGQIDADAEGRRLRGDRRHTDRDKYRHDYDECALLHRTSILHPPAYADLKVRPADQNGRYTVIRAVCVP